MSAGFGLLDRYVLRRLAGVWGTCILGFTMLFVVVDGFARLDDFQDAAPHLEKAGHSIGVVALRFYLTRVPAIVTLVGPYLTLFAAIATLLSLARWNEYVPMIMSGRGAHRVLLPVYLFAATSAVVLAAAEEEVVPRATRENAILERLVKDRGKVEVKRIPHLRDGPNAFVVSRWNPAELRLVGVSCPLFRDPTGALPEGALDAAELLYRRNPGTGEVGWYPRNGVIVPRDPGAGGALPQRVALPPDRPLPISLAPADVEVLAAGGEPGISRGELLALRERYPRQHGLTVDLHMRFTRPLSSVVLLLVAIPFVMRPEKRSIAAGLGIALGVCVAYFGADFLFRELGQRGDVNPVLAVWTPPILFTAFAFALSDRVAT